MIRILAAVLMVAVAFAEEPVKDSGTALVAAVDQKTWDFIKRQLEVVSPWDQIPKHVDKLRSDMTDVLTNYATKADVRTQAENLNDLKAKEAKDNNAAVARLAALEALDIDKVRNAIKQSISDLKQDTLNSVTRLSNDIIANHQKNQRDIEDEKQIAANALALDKTLLMKEIKKRWKNMKELLETTEEQLHRRLDALTPHGMRTTMTKTKDSSSSGSTTDDTLVAASFTSDLPVNGWKFGFLLLSAFNLGGLAMWAYMSQKSAFARIPLLP